MHLNSEKCNHNTRAVESRWCKKTVTVKMSFKIWRLTTSYVCSFATAYLSRSLISQVGKLGNDFYQHRHGKVAKCSSKCWVRIVIKEERTDASSPHCKLIMITHFWQTFSSGLIWIRRNWLLLYWSTITTTLAHNLIYIFSFCCASFPREMYHRDVSKASIIVSRIW